MKNLCCILFLFYAPFTFAQHPFPKDFADYRTIPMAEEGKGYAREILPTEFETSKEQKQLCLLVDNEHLLKDLEEGKDYEIRLEIVEIKQEYKTYQIKSPTFHRNIAIKFFISEPNWETVDSINPKWKIGDTIFDRKFIGNTYSKYVPFFYYKGRVNGCLSMNPENAIVWTNQYFHGTSIRQRKIIHKINGQYQLETLTDTTGYREITYKFDTVYQVIETIVPAEIDTFQVVHFFDENIEKVVIMIHLTTYNLIHSAHLSEWREIYCGSHYHSMYSKIFKIQQALKERGYDVEVNNIFDVETKKALIQFQKDNYLPIGQLDSETLEALDIY